MAEKLKGFEEHHVEFSSEKGGQAVGNCPFCGKDGHFYVNTTSLLWDCKVCGEKGNYPQFLYKAAMAYHEALREDPGKLRELSKDRKIAETALLKYHVGWDEVGKRYSVPVISGKGACCDIRLYRLGQKTRSSAGGSAGLFGAQFLNPGESSTVYLCEGEWDTMALWWLLARNKAKGTVVGVPGANTFKRDWVPMFTGRDVQLLYDHDNAGDQGERLARERLTGTTRTLTFLHWPEATPSGFDVRDWIGYGVKVEKIEGCWRNLQKLFSRTPRSDRFSPVHPTAAQAKAEAAGPSDDPITNEELLKAYRRWLYLPDRNVLDVMFGAAFANRLEGDPIWLFLVAPPGGSKSELLMSLSTAESIVCMTSLTPHALVSGAVWGNGKDPSLLPQLDGKILVLKDFTTITSMHFAARDEIFGILRDVYDGKTEKYFGTGVKREYKSKFGILAGVTPVIETFGTLHASLGERFLKYRLLGDTKETEESKILKAISNINSEVSMRSELCDVARRCLLREMPAVPPRFSPEQVHKAVALAQFVAWLRGVVERDRFTQHVLYRPSSEVGTRLAKQLVKLAMGVGIFRGLTELGEAEYDVIKGVAKHTCPDRVSTLLEAVWRKRQEGVNGLTTKEVSMASELPLSTVFRMLEDLALLKVVRKVGSGTKFLWTLNESMCRLIEKSEVFDGQKETPKAKPPVRKFIVKRKVRI